ncbi:hypothetical protein B0T10DRAFT_552007 [Thelonectria olida]|uniref:NACHT domain-containing protein n=1 Tax=Thelonectria olida TaxID=1576542 RepID=A0A9P8VVT8_9HYPO|nr:hypothetical protein B0T10DRAFT_552007 [Thelonectria olida]
MAEAFAGLSIAANIVQFTEYALALVSDCREIYESADGARQENLELETVIQSIHDRHSCMKTACNGTSGQGPLRKSLSFLISTLEKLKATNKSRFPKLGSLRAAIVASCYGNTLRGLEKRLLAIEEEVSREMIKILTDKQSDAMLSLRHLEEIIEQGHQKTDNRLSTVKGELMRNATQLSATQIESNDRGFAQVIFKVEELLKEVKEVGSDQIFLDSLNFEDLREREYRIKDAGVTTLDWIFNQPQTNYLDWLTSRNDVYWVQGKESDQKSPDSSFQTLILFVGRKWKVYADEEWAGSYRLVTAQFFFWNSGLPMQKSQRGLLQSLLYQIFCSYRPLIRLVRPEHSPTHWTLEELFNLVRKVVARGTSTTKYCFFIDGLDEYEGEVENIVSAVKSLGSLPTVKLCVSSRPWNSFTAAFDREGYNLVLQHFTKQDMINYTKQEFLGNEIFRQLSQADQQFHQLPAMVATKAEGVWLWAFLVIRNLLGELSGHVTFQDVKEKLESLPGELEDYYDRILAKLNPVDRIEADKILLIAIDAAKPLPVSALSWITQSYKDPWLAISSPIEPISAAYIEQTCTTWRTLLGNRCGDLLEIHRFSSDVPLLNHRVDFLHRTVRDYLTASYQQTLRRRVSDDFKTNHILCRIMLRLLKGLNVDSNAVEMKMIAVLSIVDEFLYYSRELDLMGEVDTDLVDDVDLVVSEYCRNHKNHWTNARPTPHDEYFEEFGQCTFYALAIQSKLSGYISAKLDAYPGALRDKLARPLLDYALRPSREVDFEFPFEIQRQDSPMRTEIKIIKALLDRGADVNQKIYLYSDPHGETPTVWSLFLRFCYTNRGGVHPSVLQSWYRACELLIQHGASPHLKTVFEDRSISGTATLRRGVTYTLTVAEVLTRVFPIFKARSLVQRLVDAHYKKCRTSWGYWVWWNLSLAKWEREQMAALREPVSS